MLSLSKKFLFVHPPKSAGTSISFALKPYVEDEFHILSRNPDGSPQRVANTCKKYGLKSKHHPLADYRTRLPAPLYDEMFKFSVIRNPWEKSILRFFHDHAEWDRKKFIRKCEWTYKTMRRFICLDYPFKPFEILRRKLRRPNHWRSPKTALDGDIDFLLRYEHLEADWTELCRRLDLQGVSLPHIQTVPHKHQHYTAYYDAELIEMVGTIFSEEIAFGGYRFGGGD